MGFRFLHGVHLPYDEQIYIFGLLHNLSLAPVEVREEIEEIIKSVGGTMSSALKLLLTTNISMNECAIRFYIDPSGLNRKRQEAYREIAKIIFTR